MRIFLVAAMAAAFAGPAFAEEATTLQVVTTRGIVMTAFGLQIPVTYTPDGKFTAHPPGAPVQGVWSIKGDALCTKTPMDPAEICAVYPPGKKSGDAFDVPGAMGPAMGSVMVKIN